MRYQSTLTSWADETWPEATPDEILPRLFQGGTQDEDVIGRPAARHHYARMSGLGQADYPFDLVVTLYADAQPAPWGVREIRYGFPDGPLIPHDARQAVDLARMAHEDWCNGYRVLVRCQAGVNRSGLVSALILMLEGYDASAAIDLLRARRSPVVLSNSSFESWLLTKATELIGAHVGSAA